MPKRQRYNRPTRWALIYIWLTGKPAPPVPSWNKSVLVEIAGILYPRHPARLDKNSALLESVECELQLLQNRYKHDLTTIQLFNKAEMRRVFSYIITFFERGEKWINRSSLYPRPALPVTQLANEPSPSPT